MAMCHVLIIILENYLTPRGPRGRAEGGKAREHELGLRIGLREKRKRKGAKGKLVRVMCHVLILLDNFMAPRVGEYVTWFRW